MIQAGDKFGFLTAVREAEKGDYGELRWFFKCVCRKEHVTRVDAVRRGRAKSCGCHGLVDGRCTKCGEDKPSSEFVMKRSGYFERTCKSCRIIRHLAYVKKRRKIDPEYIRKVRISEIKSRSKGSIRIGVMFGALRNGARKRGISFDISKSDIAELAEKQDWKCAKTGIKLDLTHGQGQLPFGPTIDRIDNGRGYEPGNIQLVCYLYNVAKNRFTDDDVSSFANALVEYEQAHLINTLKFRRVA